MKRGLLLSLSIYFVFLLLFPCLAIAQTVQYENQEIEQIDVELEGGASLANFDTQAILSRMKTRKGDFFSHTDFDADLKTLAKEFDHVVPRLETLDGKMYVILKIWPKPTIRTIAFVGNEKIKTSRLLKELDIKPATIFDRQTFNAAFHKLKAYYVKKGFFEAELDYQITRDENSNEVDIEIIIKEGRAGWIKQIVFHDFTSQEEAALVDMILTKKYSFFTSWLTNQGTYNEEAVQQDQFTILNFIQNEGYADANVEIKVLESSQSHRIILHIYLERGEKYYFGDITFEGNTLFDDETIQDDFTFEEGCPYSPDEIRESIRNITNTYGRKGFIDASVNFEPKLCPDKHTYSIHFTIEEGRQYFVGMIKVYGNTSTQTRVILHETLLIPGEVFNSDKLQKTEERLRNIGYFKHVNVYAVKSDGVFGLGDSYRDINIEVEETGTGHFSTSFGLSSVESYFGTIAISEKNFNYKGLGTCWTDGLHTLRGGGEYLNISATFGNKSRKYELSWTKPYFMDTKWTVGFDLENSSSSFISEAYTIDAGGITFHASYQMNPFLRTAWHYRLRNSHYHVEKRDTTKYEKALKDLDKITDPEKRKIAAGILKKEEDDNVIAHERLLRRAKHAGIVSAVGTTLFYDSTDHPTHPNKGLKSKLGVELAGAGGYHSFLGLSYMNTYYYRLHQRDALKFRCDLKFLIPYGDSKPNNLPLDEMLFLGGDETVRGYRSYRLGPHIKDDDDDPIGGISLQYYSAEYNRKIFKNFDAFIFFDAGQLSGKYLHFGRISMAAGYGIRVKLLDSLPELTFGMGYPLNPQNNSQVKKFFFQMGGRF